MESTRFFATDELLSNSLYIQQIESLDVTYFPWPWAQGELMLFLGKMNSFALAITKDDKILGFLLGEILPDLKQFHLYKILVNPNYRKKGHAHTLMGKAFQLLYQNCAVTEIYLEVSSCNKGAILLYKDFGLKMIHRKAKFYSDGSNADIMLGVIDTHLFT